MLGVDGFPAVVLLLVDVIVPLAARVPRWTLLILGAVHVILGVYLGLGGRLGPL